MHNFNSTDYIELTEKNPDPILRQHMDAEMGMLLKVANPKTKTFIDLGAGHGRFIDKLSKLGKKVIAVEINNEMLNELTFRAEKYSNVEIIKGDITKLTNYLPENIDKPVLLLLQNTLGTVEGDWKDVLKNMRDVARSNRGEIIISLFRQEALKDWGMQLYEHNKQMSGEPDLENTDFLNGIYRSKTGYVSKWWSESNIENIKETFGGKIENELWTKNYYIGYISFFE